MGTIIWLTITTVIGWAIGEYVPADPAPLIGAFAGFVVGVIIRVLVATGGSGTDDFFDAAGDLFD